MKESIFEDPLHYFCLIPAFTFFIVSLTPFTIFTLNFFFSPAIENLNYVCRKRGKLSKIAQEPEGFLKKMAKKGRNEWKTKQPRLLQFHFFNLFLSSEEIRSKGLKQWNFALREFHRHFSTNFKTVLCLSHAEIYKLAYLILASDSCANFSLAGLQ